MNQSEFVVPTTGKISGSAAIFACITFLLVLAGCGSNASVAASSVPSPTVTIAANPASITAGQTSTLTVSAANATQVTVTGTDGSSYAMPAAGGTKVVTPSATVTYTAVATGVAGKTPASATATVLVAASQALAPTVSIVANPSTVASGGASTLTVVASNATQVTLTGTDGSSYTLSATGGGHVVNPTATTIYTAVATGPGGTAKATAQVTVAPAPTVMITANPTSIASGSSSMLTVTAANATQVTLTGTDGSRYVLGATGGTQSVSPTATTTYTATATGTGGSATGTVQVMVVAAPTLTIIANPATIASGSSSTLTVTATNATQVTVTGPSGSFSLSATGGTLQVSPTATATYTATATGAGGTTSKSATVTVTAAPAPTVTLAANPPSIASGGSSTLTVTATNATQVTVTGSDNSSYTLSPAGGTQTVSPASTTTYMATATGSGGTVSSPPVTVTVAGSLQSIMHVVFMLQENHTFDNYFGMLNPYRNKNGWGGTYTVDGIDDKLNTIVNYSDPPPGSPSGTQGTPYNLFKLTSSCIDDETSSWLESYGDVNRYDFTTTRSINMDGFVHTAENYAKNCMANNDVGCAGTFTQATGKRAMGYYDEGFLNYYYYMASQFAVSDRWFSPVSSKSIDNRIATFTGGTTQGLVFDPGNDDGLPQLQIPTIFRELQAAGVSWKIYYTVSIAGCTAGAPCPASTPGSPYPATNFSSLADSYVYLYENTTGAACTPTTQPSSVVGDPTNSFCIDTNHIAPLSQYYTDLNNNALPSFAFIEAGYGVNDEHPGSGQEMLAGQLEVSKVIGAFMGSPEWKNSVFFLSYDEGGGPYDHVPPVPGSSNKNTDASLGTIPDISSIAVNPDTYNPCVPAGGKPTAHCDLNSNDPGANSADAAYQYGFAAQLGFRVPNMVISPFTRQHYVSHIPMDHTAIIKFVENRFIGPAANLTKRDAAQPNLLDFFDFTNIPWATPPTPPVPVTDATFGKNTCTPASFGP